MKLKIMRFKKIIYNEWISSCIIYIIKQKNYIINKIIKKIEEDYTHLNYWTKNLKNSIIKWVNQGVISLIKENQNSFTFTFNFVYYFDRYFDIILILLYNVWMQQMSLLILILCEKGIFWYKRGKGISEIGVNQKSPWTYWQIEFEKIRVTFVMNVHSLEVKWSSFNFQIFECPNLFLEKNGLAAIGCIISVWYPEISGSLLLQRIVFWYGVLVLFYIKRIWSNDFRWRSD